MPYLDDHLESDYEDRMDEQYDPYGYDYSDDPYEYDDSDEPEFPDESIGIATFEHDLLEYV